MWKFLNFIRLSRKSQSKVILNPSNLLKNIFSNKSKLKFRDGFNQTSLKFLTVKNLKKIRIQHVTCGLFTLILFQNQLIKFYPGKTDHNVYIDAYDVEKAINEKVNQAEQLKMEGKIDDAKSILNEALKIAEDTSIFSNISLVYDSLSTLAFQHSGLREIEEMLVRFTEKMIQLGYMENHNSIIRFKLKLSRLYHIAGNSKMAELGFRDCIRLQEEKLQNGKTMDEATEVIYLSTLFWYGRFLTQELRYDDAKVMMRKALTRLDHIRSLSPRQIVVVLYYNAEVSYFLKEFNEAIKFLMEAIQLCNEKDQNNPEYSLLVTLAKKWCQYGEREAKTFQDHETQIQASQCLNAIENILLKTKITNNTNN